MNNNNLTPASVNATTLALLSTVFSKANGLPTVPFVLGNLIYSFLNEWYADNGKLLRPDTELIENEAILYAFGRAQEMTNVAKANTNKEELLAEILGD